MEAVQVLRAAGGDLGHEFLRRDAFLLGRDHDRRAVGVVGADEMHLAPRATQFVTLALHSLEAHPDVGLDVFHHVANMEGSVGVGQGGGDEQLAGHGRNALVYEKKAFYQRMALGTYLSGRAHGGY